MSNAIWRENHYPQGNSTKVPSETKAGKGAPSSLLCAQTQICFPTDGLPQSNQASHLKNLPCLQEIARLQTCPGLLLGEAGSRKKQFSTRRDSLSANLRSLIYSKPTECLRRNRKPKTETLVCAFLGSQTP